MRQRRKCDGVGGDERRRVGLLGRAGEDLEEALASGLGHAEEELEEGAFAGVLEAEGEGLAGRQSGGGDELVQFERL